MKRQEYIDSLPPVTTPNDVRHRKMIERELARFERWATKGSSRREIDAPAPAWLAWEQAASLPQDRWSELPQVPPPPPSPAPAPVAAPSAPSPKE